MSDDFRRAADSYWRAAEARSWTRGILGKPNGDGTYTVLVADMPGYYWVRVSTEGTQSLTTAKSIGRVAARPNLRVRMKREDNAYVIYDADAAYNATVTATDPTNSYGVNQHTHRTGTGLEYEIEAKLLEPGRVIPNTTVSAFWVYINAFRYYYAGGWVTWPGGSLSIAPAKPTTSGKHAWVVVGIDPASNAAVAVGGAEEDTTTTLTLAMLDDIDIGTMIPCGALQVATADADVSDYTKYYDAHGWFSAGAGGFDDAEGDPADVGTTADGTSDNAARRDHVHALPDMAQGYVIGRYSSGTGPVEALNVDTGAFYLDGNALKFVGLNGPDVSGTADSASATIAPQAVSNAKFRNSGALAVVARAANSTGSVADLQATPAGDDVLLERSSALVWGKIQGVNIDDSEIGNAKLVDVSTNTLKGRTAAGTGPVSDLTMAEVIAMLGGTLYTDSVGAGNVSTGEDTLSTYTIAADQTPGNGAIWFEAVGIYAANGNSKRIRIYYGTDLIFDNATTTSGGAWLAKGRIVVVGTSAQRAHVTFRDNSGIPDLQYTDCTQDTTDPITFLVTGEATGTDDIDLKTLILGWTK